MEFEFSQKWWSVKQEKISRSYQLMQQYVEKEIPLIPLLESLDEVIVSFGLKSENLSLQTIRALVNEMFIFAESRDNLDHVTRHYLRDQDLYLQAAEDLPDELKTPGNVAVLLGCGNMVSAYGFERTIAQISPDITPVIIDVNTDHFKELKPSIGATVVGMSALKTGFATGSVAVVHSNYVGGQIQRDYGIEGIWGFLNEVRRISHPQGSIALIEEPIYFEGE